MGQSINYDLARDALQKLNTDDTISSAHGLLCGFYCVKQDISIDDWLNEVLVNIDLNNIVEKESHQVLAEIFNNTSEQLADPTLNFWPVIADDVSSLREQSNTLIEWCQGFLVGLGLSSVETSDEEVLEMIKDISEISQLDAELLDSEENTQDFYEIVEFIRMGVLFIQETLQPSKQDFISPTQIH
jgi:yecA family protein